MLFLCQFVLGSQLFEERSGIPVYINKKNYTNYTQNPTLRDKESKSQREGETKCQRVKKSKSQGVKETKRGRVKKSKRQGVKETEGVS